MNAVVGGAQWCVVRADGDRFPLVRPLVVGRLPDCDVVVPDGLVSGHHLRIEPADGGVLIEDLGSSNGTFIDGQRIVGPRLVTADTVVQVGAAAVTIARAGGAVAGSNCFVVVQSGRSAGEIREIGVGDELVVGRAGECGLVVDDQLVSNRHLRVTRPVDAAGGEVLLEDLGSANGTLLDDRPLVPRVATAAHWNDLIQVGDTHLVLSDSATPPSRRAETVVRAVPAELKAAAAASSGANNGKSRTPIYAGGAVVVALLIGAVAFLALRGGGDGGGSIKSVVSEETPATVQVLTKLSDGVASGSGVVVDAEAGLVLTNAHVIAAGNSFEIRTSSNPKAVAAKLVASMPCDDLALLQIENSADRSGLRTVELADPGSIEQGETVVALGFPGSAESASSDAAFASDQMSATDGIVSKTSAKYIDPNSGVAPLQDTIQHTAAINHGNSGGPLFDLDGRLVGLNVAMFADASGQRAEGENYAVSAARIKQVLDRLKGGESVAEFGFDLTPAYTKDQPDTPAGLEIVGVAAGGPAAEAGIPVGRFLVAVDDKEVTDLITYCAIVGDGERHVVTTYNADADTTSDDPLSPGTW